jgi:hypothetical protein
MRVQRGGLQQPHYCGGQFAFLQAFELQVRLDGGMDAWQSFAKFQQLVELD